MNPAVVEKTNTERIMRTISAVMADATGQLPTELQILKIGMWDTPSHGMFMITPDDLQQYVDNFKAGIAQTKDTNGNYIGVPIDFKHEIEGEAAGWIKELYINGDTLWGKVTWSSSGVEALKGERYKCFSPWFYPASFGGWEDPEAYGDCVENVLAGGALTNIPLFKGLTSLMASQASGETEERRKSNVIYISANAKEKSMPTLEEVRAKDASALTEEEKTFVAEHKAELTAEEQTKFGLEVAPAAPAPEVTPAAEPAPVEGEVPADVQASAAKHGYVVMAASKVKELEDTANEYRTEKADSIVDKHIARGAVVASEKANWTKQLLAASGEARTGLESMLAALPDHPVMADTQGGKVTGSTAATAVGELHEKTEAAVKASAASGTPVKYADAQKKILDEDKDLSGRVNAERQAQ